MKFNDYGFRRVTCSSIDFKGKEKEKGFQLKNEKARERGFFQGRFRMDCNQVFEQIRHYRNKNLNEIDRTKIRKNYQNKISEPGRKLPVY